MQRLHEVRPGDTITASAWNDLVHIVKSLRPIAGPGIHINRTLAGTSYRASTTPCKHNNDSPHSNQCYILKVISRSGIGYLATPIANNEEDVNKSEFCLPIFNMVNDLPEGTPFIAFPTTMETVGGWTA
jgi:hypothetical protein